MSKVKSETTSIKKIARKISRGKKLTDLEKFILKVSEIRVDPFEKLKIPAPIGIPGLPKVY